VYYTEIYNKSKEKSIIIDKLYRNCYNSIINITKGLKMEENTISIKKVALSDEMFRRLKAIGIMFEDELETNKEPQLIGKGIEKILNSFKDEIPKKFF